MTPEAYAATQRRLIAAARDLCRLDLPAFLAAADHAHAVAPITDPTLYRLGACKLVRVQRLARAAMALRGEAIAQLREEQLLVAEARELGRAAQLVLEPPPRAPGPLRLLAGTWAAAGGRPPHPSPGLGIEPARSRPASEPASPADPEGAL